MPTSRVSYRPCCPHCGDPLTPGGVALACGPAGATRIPLPPYCASQACAQTRDDAALKRAIAAGIVTDEGSDRP